nr:hypothetical protein [uncultured Oscillibacter sp.]
MEFHVRNESRIVEIWLTRTEGENAQLREKLKPLYQEYQAKNYLVAVFQSGSEDLAENTSALLCTNRIRLARQEVEQERQSGPTMNL